MRGRNKTTDKATLEAPLAHVVDGAIVVVDPIQYNVVTTSAILHQVASFNSHTLIALLKIAAARIKPILFIDKLDEMIMNNMDTEEMYKKLRNVVCSAELITSLHNKGDHCFKDLACPAKVATGSVR